MKQQAVTFGDSRTTFYTLDLLRGVAAITVMLYHRVALPFSATGAYLSVDLFFALSGVVVAEAYAGRLASGWTVGRFALVRLVRLWPLYVVGSLVSVAAAGLTMAIGAVPFWEGNLLKIVAMGALFLPGLRQPDISLFPLNAAAWSLFAELSVNFGFAMVCRVRLLRWWPVVVAISVAFFAFELERLAPYRHGLDFGAWNLLGGVSRACLSFSIGVLLHRLWGAGKLPAVDLHPALFVVGFLLLVLAVPNSTGWALTVVLFGFPVLIAAAMTSSPAGTRRLSLISGRVSYPIYTLHLPMFCLIDTIFGGPNRAPTWSYLLGAAIVVLLAMPLDKYVDAPIRRRLSRWLGLSRRSVTAAEAL